MKKGQHIWAKSFEQRADQASKQINEYTFRLSPPPRSMTFLYRLNKLIAIFREDRYSSSDEAEPCDWHYSLKNQSPNMKTLNFISKKQKWKNSGSIKS